MLKHILTGQPSSAGSRHHNDYQPQNQQQAHQQTPPVASSATVSSSTALHHHHHHHNNPPSSSGGHPHHQHFTPASPSSRLASGRLGSSDVYDSVVSPVQRIPTVISGNGGSANSNSNNALSHQPTPSSTHRHPLNHSQLSVNNLSQRLNHSHALNLSTLSTSKHSVNSASPVVGNNNNNCNSNNNNNNNNSGMHLTHMTQVAHGVHQANGGLDISRLSRLPSQTTPSPAPAAVHAPVVVAAHHHVVASPPLGGNGVNVARLDTSWSSSSLSKNPKSVLPIITGQQQQEAGVKEMLTFLGLLCLVSLLLAMLSHIFLLKISPLTVTPSSLISPEEYTIVYEVTLALCALALSLNLCCLLVCAIQFLFAVKLVKSSYQGHRTNKYLQKSSISRVCAVGGFFVSIPVFLTGMILYTFIQFHSTPAIVMSVFIGLGIVFCGCAMVHNVFVWQREKTNAVKALARAQCEAAAQLQRQQQLQQQQQQLQQQQQQHQHSQHQHSQQSRAATLHRGGGCAAAAAAAPRISGVATTTLQHARGSTAPYTSSSHHHPHHHHHQHRHVQMSPPLLLSSSSTGLAATHNHTGGGGGATVAGNHRILATPPTTPGDRSPPSPSGNNNNNSSSSKHNRSQHLLQRETSGSVSPGLPQATLDLSSATNTNSPHELSTLV